MIDIVTNANNDKAAARVEQFLDLRRQAASIRSFAIGQHSEFSGLTDRYDSLDAAHVLLSDSKGPRGYVRLHPALSEAGTAPANAWKSPAECGKPLLLQRLSPSSTGITVGGEPDNRTLKVVRTLLLASLRYGLANGYCELSTLVTREGLAVLHKLSLGFSQATQPVHDKERELYGVSIPCSRINLFALSPLELVHASESIVPSGGEENQWPDAIASSAALPGQAVAAPAR